MLDDLRKQADDAQYDELVSQDFSDDLEEDHDNRFLGMTPVQRLVLAVMLLVITFLVGALWLLVNEKIIPPFM